MQNNNTYKQNKRTHTVRRVKFPLRAKLLTVFVAVMLVPTVTLTVITRSQITTLSNQLRDISVTQSTVALNEVARDSVERMTTSTAATLADFLYQCDRDVLLLSGLMPGDTAYRHFSENRQRGLTTFGEWTLNDDGTAWVETITQESEETLEESSNPGNNTAILGSGFRQQPSETYDRYHEMFPLYDEITFIDLSGQEVYKYVSPNSPKVNYPMNAEKVDVSSRENTYIMAETYWEHLQELSPGEIYVSDVIGAYVGTHYIGTYTPEALKEVPETHPNYEQLQKIANLQRDAFIEQARSQAFAGMENPVGQRFEGIVRWSTPAIDETGEIMGYVTMALNHDHILDFVNHITPMPERTTVLPDPSHGNYALLFDYECRAIAHPRHHSIVGYNPLTGEPQVPWLEGTPDDPASPFAVWYDAGGREWLENNPSWDDLSAEARGTSWGEFFAGNKDDMEVLAQFGERPLRDEDGNVIFDDDGNAVLDHQSIAKTPAGELTAAGFVGLDGRYLNNAPQCTGWMELTENGGSGSFYAYWSGILKLTTAGTVGYYTGNFSTEAQGNSRGFGFVSIGAGIEDVAEPAVMLDEQLRDAIRSSLNESIFQIIATSIAIFALILIATALVTSSVTRNINQLVAGISRFRAGHSSYRINSRATDEFGILADSFDEMADSIEENVKDIQEARKRAEAANEAKTNFLSNMSHEIRTPLNVIINMASVGKTSDDSDKKNASLEKITNASVYLLGIIKDILDVSMIEARKLSLSLIKFRLDELICKVEDMINYHVHQKNQNFSITIDDGVPNDLYGDDQRLAQVLMNILSNAVKFSPEGGDVTLHVSEKGRSDEYSTLLFTIRDNGIGISEEQRKLLFQAFQQAETSTSRRFGGTGLGLYISKNIVEMMDGEIWVESELGEGTTVSFTVRLACGVHASAHSIQTNTEGNDYPQEAGDEDIEEPPADLTGYTLLLAEDIEINREIIMALLEPTNVTIEYAVNGIEAVEKFTAEPDKYDLIFMDIQMPEMDGCEATKLIRASDAKNAADIPIIAMTANAFKEDIEKHLAIGMNDHISKPVELKVIMRLLRKYLLGE